MAVVGPGVQDLSSMVEEIEISSEKIGYGKLGPDTCKFQAR